SSRVDGWAVLRDASSCVPNREGEDGEQVEDQGQRPCSFGDGVARYAVAVCLAQRAASARAEVRLRSGAVWCLLGASGREGDPELRDAGRGCLREERDDARRAARSVGQGERHDGCEPGVASVAAGVDRCAGSALWLLPERHDDPGRRSLEHDEESDGGSDPDGDERSSLPLWDLSADPDGDQAGRRGDGEGRQVMTGFMHERAISRKTFVKGGGALIVGFSLAGTAGKAQAANANTPFGQRSPADFLPDPFQIDSWITVNADNTVTVTHGETELGHGTPTGILMLVAEELDMNMSQMHFAHVESWLQAVGGGSGSSGISTRSQTIRTAAALAKQTLLGFASKQLGVAATQLSVADGVVSGGGKTIKYGDLLGGK